jgi:hypothetical protein
VNYPEHQFQQAAYVYLRAALPGAAIWSTDHAGKRTPMAGARLKQRGVIPGISDMFVYWAGQLVALELKAGKNDATEGQNSFGAMIRDNGGRFYVVWCIADIETALRGIGFPLRATTMTAQDRDMKLAAPSVKKASKPRAAKPAASKLRKWARIQSGMRVAGGVG